MRKKRNVEVKILFKKIKYSTEEVVSMVRRTFELPFDVEVTPVTETFECKENFPDKEIE